MVGAPGGVLCPYLATRPAVEEHVISVTFKKVESRYLLPAFLFSLGWGALPFSSPPKSGKIEGAKLLINFSFD